MLYMFIYLTWKLLFFSRNRDINAFPLENKVYVNGFGLETICHCDLQIKIVEGKSNLFREFDASNEMEYRRHQLVIIMVIVIGEIFMRLAGNWNLYFRVYFRLPCWTRSITSKNVIIKKTMFIINWKWYRVVKLITPSTC